MSGTVIDKATAFKNSITGAGINKIVCKASSHDLSGPKKKHVDCELMERGEFVSCALSSQSTVFQNLG